MKAHYLNDANVLRVAIAALRDSEEVTEYRDPKNRNKNKIENASHESRAFNIRALSVKTGISNIMCRRIIIQILKMQKLSKDFTLVN